jgi:hypothetical protein
MLALAKGKRMSEFRNKIEQLLNSVSAENGSNTPDFILADYVIACLTAFDSAVRGREMWYGRWNAADATSPDAAASPSTSDALSTTEAPSKLTHTDHPSADEPIEYRLDHDTDLCGENCKGH